MATLYERNGVFYISCYFRSKRYKRSTGCRTPRAARLALERCEERIERGEHPFGPDAVTFEAAIPAYLEYCNRFNAPRTVYMKKIYCRRFAAHFGSMPLSLLDREDIERYLRTRNGVVGPNTINHEYATIRNMLNYAVERRWLDKNPATRIRLLPEDPRPPRILTDEERCRYFKWCLAINPETGKENDRLLYDLSTIAFNTALRPSDILKIQGKDVDVERASLCVKVKKLRGKLKFVPLNKAGLEVLSRRKDVYGDDYLFPGRNGGHQVEFKRRFKRAVEATDLGDFTFGQFRHNCAVALLRRGADIYILKELLGHASVTTTERYALILADQPREAVNRLDE